MNAAVTKIDFLFCTLLYHFLHENMHFGFILSWKGLTLLFPLFAMLQFIPKWFVKERFNLFLGIHMTESLTGVTLPTGGVWDAPWVDPDGRWISLKLACHPSSGEITCCQSSRWCLQSNECLEVMTATGTGFIFPVCTWMMSTGLMLKTKSSFIVLLQIGPRVHCSW